MRKERREKLKGNIKKFYLMQILFGICFFTPILVLYWQDMGLNLTEIMTLQSIYAILVVFLEVPTGYVADVFGRKKCLIGFGIFLSLGLFMFTQAQHFYHFLIVEVLWAIAISLGSGADAALVYDTLVDLKQEHRFKKIWGNGVFFHLSTAAVANVIGGFIAKIGFIYTFYAMIPFVILTIPVAFSLKEPMRHKRIFKRGYILELFKIMKYTLIENKKLRWLLVYSGIIFAFMQSAFWLYQPYFKLTGLDVVYFGIVFASFQLVAAVSSKYSHELEEKLGRKYSLILLVVLLAASYFLMSNFVFLFSFSFAFLHQFIRGFSHTVITDYVNRLTTSDIRATVLSARSMVGRLIYAIILPIIGWSVDAFSLLQAFTMIGIAIVIAGTVILVILHKDRVI